MMQLLLTIVLATLVSTFFVGLGLLALWYQRQRGAPAASYQRTAEQVFATQEPVLLYLRPFTINTTETSITRVYRAVTDVVSPVELAWLSALRDQGVVVGVAFPGERSLQSYGVIRAQCPSLDWEVFIRRWLARASHVVIVVAATGSVSWLIRTLIREGWLARAIFIVNEENGEPAELLRFLRRELRGFGEALDPASTANCYVGFDQQRELLCVHENLGYGAGRHAEALRRLLNASQGDNHS